MLKTTLYLAITSIILKVVDVWTIYMAVTMYDSTEVNPVVRYGIGNFGLLETMILKDCTCSFDERVNRIKLALVCAYYSGYNDVVEKSGEYV